MTVLPIELLQEQRLLRRWARQIGRCPEVSPSHYICTLEDPHETHEAWLDGKLLARWDGAGG